MRILINIKTEVYEEKSERIIFFITHTQRQKGKEIPIYLFIFIGK